MDGITEGTPEAEEAQEAEPDGFVCSLCQRGKHSRCTDPACTCCLGNDE